MHYREVIASVLVVVMVACSGTPRVRREPVAAHTQNTRWYYSWEHASISECDFTSAHLDYCRFHACDPRTLKFPRWPCFTILDPIGNSQKLRSVEWPGIFGRIIIEHLHDQPVSTVAVTLHAPTVAKQHNTTAEALRAVVEKFDCIIY